MTEPEIDWKAKYFLKRAEAEELKLELVRAQTEKRYVESMADEIEEIEKANRELRSRLAFLELHHARYSAGIAEAIGPNRERRQSGEPAQPDFVEIRKLRRSSEGQE